MKVLSFFPDYGNQSLLLSGGEQVPDLRVEWIVLPNHLFQDLADDRCSQGCAPPPQCKLVPTGVGQHLNVVGHLFGQIQHRFERAPSPTLKPARTKPWCRKPWKSARGTDPTNRRSPRR